MHDDRSIVEARLRRVVRERIEPAMHGERVPLDVTAWEVPGEPVTAAEAATKTYAPFSVGAPFGRPWGTTWFRMSGTVPERWAGAAVDAVIDLGFSNMAGFQSEGLLWHLGDDGAWAPVRGLHPLNRDVLVGAAVAGGEQVSYVVEAASNPPIANDRPDPNSDLATASTAPMYRLARAELVVVNTEVAALRQDVRALNGLMKQLPLDQPRRHEILRALEAMLDRLDLEDVVGTAPAARAELAGVLASPAVASAHRISAIGHAHIDSAWLWPLRETVRKCARTFSNVLMLMDRYPEFRFGCSQAAQYEWMREHYPSIFEAIGRRVAEGRWIPLGGMWVEADTNLAGGEALIRQITHGQRYFEEHFGVTCTEVWIPDVFGYPASLPQIMKTCGIDRFLTQKLSWNKTNRFPHHTFWWEGIDGSTVFTHFPPVETYNATFNGIELANAVRTFADKGVATRSLMPFGYGDGGGGPTAQMMEQYRRVRDLEGSPRVEIESPEEFFDAAIADYPDAPRWVGELYFEMHRGTFTSQAGTKAGNRRCELLLREAELWCVAAYGGREGDGYPAAALDRLWKTVLLHQFHDILPGSSIGWVHREAEVAYAQVADELTGIIDAALASMGAGTLAVANPAPFDGDTVEIVDAPALTGDPECQVLSDGRVAARLAVPAGAVVALEPLPVPSTAHAVATVEADGTTRLGNDRVRISLDASGLITSFVDLSAGRELVAPGARANLLQLHQDLPNEYDAWDIEEFHRRRVVDIDTVESIEVLDDGPLVARVRVSRSFRSSTISQVLELRAGSARLDVVTDVDWHEHEQMLKVAFPLDLHTSEMTREIQFGHLTTAIHTNTSWDAARFEVCAHRWVDVAEPGYGVAVLNDSKYGYDATRDADAGADRPVTTVRLTLLRGARYPDPEADQGRHHFTYSVLGHAGDFRRAGVVAEGYRLNTGVRVVPGVRGALDASQVVAAADPAVVVEAVKVADDGSGDVIVRCYESWGGRARTDLALGVPFSSVARVDARERPLADAPAVAVDGGRCSLSLRPFEIVTLRFRR
ncbi:MAG: glycoside hydrolase family 38 C-terminal domain-containing protein [Acidimicrobiales bacterium]